MNLTSFTCLAAAIFAAVGATVSAQTSFKFDFGGEPKPGWTRVAPTDLYSAETGYGFEPGAKLTVENASAPSLASTNPFYFSVKVPEGNYQVTATLDEGSVTTIKAELRRLMDVHDECPHAANFRRQPCASEAPRKDQRDLGLG